jgi:hypothetical protein
MVIPGCALNFGKHFVKVGFANGPREAEERIDVEEARE